MNFFEIFGILRIYLKRKGQKFGPHCKVDVACNAQTSDENKLVIVSMH